MVQMQGGLPVSSFIGIIVGHAYFFVDRVLPVAEGEKRWTETPVWFANLFGEAGQEWVAPGAEKTGGKAGGSGGGSSGGWKSGGQRLGTED
jgi:hypothetical protein